MVQHRRVTTLDRITKTAPTAFPAPVSPADEAVAADDPSAAPSSSDPSSSSQFNKILSDYVTITVMAVVFGSLLLVSVIVAVVLVVKQRFRRVPEDVLE